MFIQWNKNEFLHIMNMVIEFRGRLNLQKNLGIVTKWTSDSFTTRQDYLPHLHKRESFFLVNSKKIK